ncbi:MAG: prepilin-type N-terminal cleavage/methylation domain-containing protein [Candidatus Curtissbacteria bacterium]|nr:prepilin-type N-terminal cleavage/methylation domain-containing protein [Candidatus Curtissbacteria bacterium]
MPFNKVNSKWKIVNRNRNRKSIHHSPLTIHPKVKHGFTLVELLIVIVLIALLVGIGSFAYTTAQVKARDSRRKSDLLAIKGALELSRQDAGGFYPTSLASLAPTYIKIVPQDPKTASDYIYTPQPASCSTCTSYNLQTILENTDDQSITSSQLACPDAPSGSYYVVCPTK